MRESIDERPRRWRRILNEPGLKKQFLPSAAKISKPEVALKAFAEKNREGALKVRPKVGRDELAEATRVSELLTQGMQGYNADHRDIGLLKLKNYVLGTKVADDVVFGPGSREKLEEIFRPMVPFVCAWAHTPLWDTVVNAKQISFLNSIVRPDPNVDEDDSGDDEDDGGGDGGGNEEVEGEEEEE